MSSATLRASPTTSQPAASPPRSATLPAFPTTSQPAASPPRSASLPASPTTSQPAASPPDWFSSCLPSYIASSSLPQKVGAEIISTFIMVFTVCGSAMVDVKTHGAVTHLGTSATSGLTVMAMIYSVGHISGAHMNPAVTLAFATVRHFPWCHVPAYLAAQMLAAIVASFALRLIFGSVAEIGATLPSEGYIQSFILEILVTFILMFVVSAVATDTRAIGELAGLAVGSTVGLNSLFAGPISGASMNPARSIGPALASNNLDSLWLYIVGPIVGAITGALSYNLIRLVENPELAQSRSSKSFRRQRSLGVISSAN